MGECEGRPKAPNDHLPFVPSSPDKAGEHDSGSSNTICKSFSGVQASPGNAEKIEDCGSLWPQMVDLMSLPACEPLKSESSASPAEFDHGNSELELKLKDVTNGIAVAAAVEKDGCNAHDLHQRTCLIRSPAIKNPSHSEAEEGDEEIQCNHTDGVNSDQTEPVPQGHLPPRNLIEKVCTILCRGSDGGNWGAAITLNKHSLFTQLDILCHSQQGNIGWKQMSRWLKYEEKVEVGGRWSKPHVSTASLHALLEIRRAMTELSCAVELDVTSASGSLADVSATITAGVARQGRLDETALRNLRQMLLRPHKHKNRHGNRKKCRQEGNGDKKGENCDEKDEFSEWKGASCKGIDRRRSSEVAYRSRTALAQRRKSLVRRDGKDYWAIYTTYHQGINPDNLQPYSPNKKLMRKIPIGAEAASIMIGQVDFLEELVLAFYRFHPSQVIDELTEVAIPTRFIIVVLGPQKHSSISEYFEIGRAFAALLNDKVFCEVAYKASSVQDLLDGLEEFMDDLTVLPPSIWDPNTRLEPPQKTRSMDKIRRRLNEVNRYVMSPETLSGHDNDDSLRRSGRIFGGLVADMTSRYRFFLSDFTDGLHLQCFASIIFLYFACITPIVTFGGLMGQKTDNYMGTMETLMSGAICGVLYAIFCGQPLNIIGSTGPLLVFESILYHMCKESAIDFMSFRFWIGIWVFFYLILIVAFDLSAFVRYITRFTEESFAVLISVIFIYEACSKILEIWTTRPMRRNRIDGKADFTCYCSSPHLVQYSSANLQNSSYSSATDQSGDAGFFHRSSDNGTLIGDVNSSTLYDFANWSATLPEDCLTFRHRVVIQYGCASASDCTERGWTLSGLACQDETVMPDVFLLSCMLFFGTFSAAMFFRTFRNTRYFPTQVRTLVGDFAVFLAVIMWTAVDVWFGLDTPKLEVPNEFKPTLEGRGWFINPLTVTSWWLLPLAALPGALATILVFLDQQITAVIVNRKEHKLKKGHGYHLDLFVLSFLIATCSLMGLPWFVAATVRAITHVRSLIRESEVKAPGERPQMLGVREQRLTGVCIHLLIGFSTLLTSVLKYIPMPVLYGVFMYMGITSLAGVQFIERILIMFMPVKYQPDYIYLRHVQTARVHYFTIIQILCSAMMWIVKSIKATSIAFPLVLIGLVLTRKAMDFIFTQRDLYWLDHLLPDETRRRCEDLAMNTSAVPHRYSVTLQMKELPCNRLQEDEVAGDPAALPLNAGLVHSSPGSRQQLT